MSVLLFIKKNLMNHQFFETKQAKPASGELPEMANPINNDQLLSMDEFDCPQEAEDEMIKVNPSEHSLASLCPAQGNTTSTTTTTNSLSQKRAIDDEEETFESVYGNLPADLKPLKDCMYKAQGCCLLLILKQFLKEVYTISDR
jgi:hypothetical protein